MTQGFVQVAPDGGGKQLGNETYTVPVGTPLTDGSGNVTFASTPLTFFREHIISADPTNPLGVASVKGGIGPNAGEYALSVNLTPGQSDHNAMLLYLQSIDASLAVLAGAGSAQQQSQFISATAGTLGAGLAGQVRPQIGDKFGRNIVIPQTLRELVTSSTATITTTAETAISPAISGDTITVYDLQAIIASNTSATAVRVDIRDQFSTVANPASQNAIIPIWLPAGDTRGISIGGALIPQSNTGQQWTATLSAGVTDVRVWAMYAKNQR